jgi:hypothetical protein
LYINSSEGTIAFSIDQVTGAIKKINQEPYAPDYRIAMVGDESVIVSTWDSAWAYMCPIYLEGKIAPRTSSFDMDGFSSPFIDFAVLDI